MQMWIQHSLDGRGLLSAEDKIASKRIALHHYLKDYSDALMKKVVALSLQIMQLLFLRPS